MSEAQVMESVAPALAAEPVDRGRQVAPQVRRWLLFVWFAIALMVAIGGITRLTGSGLSITEWQPLMGAIPPLSEADWHEVFEKYKASPEYRQANHWMSLADFQRIFFWEYVHRLWGRLIGVFVLAPFLYFLWRKQLSRELAWKTLGVFALGGLQGAVGWYMVQSGLVNEPRVSHYRLAMHLVLAFATGALVLWLALGPAEQRERGGPARTARSRHLGAVWALLGLLLVQIVYGAFMAGTRAGYYYGTFPDMHGHYGPAPFFTGDSVWADALNSPPAIHYLHRLFGWLTLFYAIGLWAFLRRVEPRVAVRRAALLVLAVVFVQFNLGALTVIQRVDLPFAVLHQVVAYFLLSAVVVLLHRALATQRNSNAPSS